MPVRFQVFLINLDRSRDSFRIFYKRASYQTKKTAYPIIMIAIGPLFSGSQKSVMPRGVRWFFMAALAVIMWLIFGSLNFALLAMTPYAATSSPGISR